MIDIKSKKECCGCHACGDVCAKGAISFAQDDEGFLYPQVDLTKCVKCGRCLDVCPQLQVELLPSNEFCEPKCFAAVHKNLATRFDSTSGGAFSALANVIYRQGGYVGGAVWTEDFHIMQYVSDKKSDLLRLRSSKYAQSDARGFYKAVGAAVATGKPVMVCGTPCQMAALRLFFGKKTPENLYVVDFICRGNNSPLVWRKYLDWQESRVGGKVVYVKPKNKELGWRNLTTKLVFSNKQVVYDTKVTSYFTKGYLLTNAYCRPSCYECKFKGVPRYADISLADCWGREGMLPQAFDRDLGTSLVMVNNAKGEALFKKASESMDCRGISWKDALAGNSMLVKSIAQPSFDREVFFKVLSEEGFEGIIKRYIERSSRDLSLRQRLKRAFKIARRVLSLLRRPKTFCRALWLNGVFAVLSGRPIIRAGEKTHLEIGGELNLHSDMTIGVGFFKNPPTGTSLAIQKGGSMTVNRPFALWYGADVEVFSGGKLICEGDGGFNIGATIVCADTIKIGRGVMGGRHVTIRDNNGGHWMNLPGYKNSKPVEIGDHVWLCEGCTIMPGVKIGAGAVVGAKAVVFNNVPSNAMVMGNPAEIVCEQVEWKY